MPVEKLSVEPNDLERDGVEDTNSAGFAGSCGIQDSATPNSGEWRSQVRGNARSGATSSAGQSRPLTGFRLRAARSGNGGRPLAG